MLRILHDTNYDFIRWWKVMAAITIAFIVLGLGSLAIKPPNYSIEFTGGTLLQLEFAQPPDVGVIRSTLDQAGIHGAEIQQFGTNREFTVRAQDPREVAAQSKGAEGIAVTIGRVLKQKFGENALKVVRTEGVGPRVGQELRRGAIIAILLSFLITLVYLSIRFEWRFATAAVIATSHDVFTTIAFLKLMHLEISLTVVAGLLTVLGYSLNDTIIIFDRVREDLKKNRTDSLYTVLNKSINETLPRSVLTHGTTMSSLIALTIFGGEVIRPFALVMLFGVFTGTFSSIYIASPVLMAIEKRWPGPAARGHLGPRKATPPAPSRKPQTV